MSLSTVARFLTALALLLGVCVCLAAQEDTADEESPADRQGGGGVFSLEVLSYSGVIGVIIAAIAFVLLTLVIYYLLTLRRGVFIPTALLAELDEAMKAHQTKRVMEICQVDASLLSRALAAGLSRRADGYAEMVEAVEAVGQEESMRLHQNVGYLALIGSVSPMLGLLGTVYGMIASFRTVAEQAGYLQPGRLATGIYTALTTTLMGLIVAIPAMAAYVYFRNRVLNLLSETAVVVEELIYPFKKGKFKEAPAAQPARAQAPPGASRVVNAEVVQKPEDAT